MKKTANAPSNIAFIKYWGKIDEKLNIPTNGSVSMNLSNLTTTTTVEFLNSLDVDDVLIDGRREKDQIKRVIGHLDRIRKLAHLTTQAKVVSQNSFPASTGLSSSASGFAALTTAAAAAAGLSLSERELSILARQGSGSACRSIPDGFVEWVPGTSNQTSYAISLYPPRYWDIVDIVVVVSREPKDIPSSKGQSFASSSPFFRTRLKNIAHKIQTIKRLIKEMNFKEFGELVEAEALALHAIMMTSKPPLIYILPETLHLMRKVREWRSEGLPVYFTINTGQNVHLICAEKNTKKVASKLAKETFVRDIIVNHPSKGARLADVHLF